MRRRRSGARADLCNGQRGLLVRTRRRFLACNNGPRRERLVALLDGDIGIAVRNIEHEERARGLRAQRAEIEDLADIGPALLDLESGAFDRRQTRAAIRYQDDKGTVVVVVLRRRSELREEVERSV